MLHGALPSTWRRPTCPRIPAASTCPSPWASWLPAARSTRTSLAGYEFAGELSLSGELRPVRGALAMSLALHTQGSTATRLVLPRGQCAEEAALVPGAQVYRRAATCWTWCSTLCPSQQLTHRRRSRARAGAWWKPPRSRSRWRMRTWPMCAATAAPKRALEIAAAGGHSLLMTGPPGSGKSMLAQRFAGLLPPMTVDEALQSAAISSLAGRFSLSPLGPAPDLQPAPQRQCGGAGGRWFTTAPRRDLAGAPRCVVPR
jgi:magnesium chelatase family protein